MVKKTNENKKAAEKPQAKPQPETSEVPAIVSNIRNIAADLRKVETGIPVLDKDKLIPIRDRAVKAILKFSEKLEKSIATIDKRKESAAKKEERAKKKTEREAAKKQKKLDKIAKLKKELAELQAAVEQGEKKE